MRTVALIVGTRPNFMKAAPLYDAFIKDGKSNIYIIHTGQHYDYNMSDIFFEQLGLDKATVVSLNTKSGTQNTQIANIMLGLEAEFTKNKPNMVIVFGDVTSTVAAAMTCNKMGIKVSHVEAGNRSFDRSMPEEINRVVTDVLCDYHFVSEPNAMDNLRCERLIRNDILDEQHVFYVGNTMIDTLYKLKPFAEKTNTYQQLGLEKGEYILTTLHRPSNVDDDTNLKQILDAFGELANSGKKIVFPVHPRKREHISKLIESGGYGSSGNIILSDPLGYIEFMNLNMNCAILLTDSGGIQEESTVLNKPCITLRPNTERPITCTHGTNYLLTDINAKKIVHRVNMVFDGIITYDTNSSCKIPLWDGLASERIVAILNLIMK